MVEGVVIVGVGGVVNVGVVAAGRPQLVDLQSLPWIGHLKRMTALVKTNSERMITGGD